MIDTATHKARLAEELEGVVTNGRIAFTPDGLHLYAVSEGSDLVQVLEVATGRIVAVVDVFGGRSTDVAVSRDGRHVCVTQRPGNALERPLWVIETTTRKVIGSPAKWSARPTGWQSRRTGRPSTWPIGTRARYGSSRSNPRPRNPALHPSRADPPGY